MLCLTGKSQPSLNLDMAISFPTMFLCEKAKSTTVSSILKV